jgi:hypothetical protein
MRIRYAVVLPIAVAVGMAVGSGLDTVGAALELVTECSHVYVRCRPPPEPVQILTKNEWSRHE